MFGIGQPVAHKFIAARFRRFDDLRIIAADERVERNCRRYLPFTEDIEQFMDSINGIEVSSSVKSIVKGGGPQFYGKPFMEKISAAPTQFIGIFKVPKANTIGWDKVENNIGSKPASNSAKNADLKKNFIHEREVVAYSPDKMEPPLVQISNPFFPFYMYLVNMKK